MKKPRRKTLTVQVEITVPSWMTAAEARREVRTLINHQANYMSGRWSGSDLRSEWLEVHEKTVRARRVSPARA